jgi:hypothetical protein
MLDLRQLLVFVIIKHISLNALAPPNRKSRCARFHLSGATRANSMPIFLAATNHSSDGGFVKKVGALALYVSVAWLTFDTNALAIVSDEQEIEKEQITHAVMPKQVEELGFNLNPNHQFFSLVKAQ